MRVLTMLSAVLLLSVSLIAQPLIAPEQGPSRQELLDRLESLETAGAARSMSPVGPWDYVETLRELGYYDRIVEHLEWQIQELDGVAGADMWRVLGEAAMRSGPGFREKAFDALTRALELAEDDADAKALLGQLLHREGRYEHAAFMYDGALEVVPGHPLATIGRAALLVRTGEVVQASQRIDALGAEAQQHDTETRLMLRSAIDAFEHRGGWIDDDYEHHSAYARLLYRAGRVSDALLSARRALAHNPAAFEIWNFLAAMQLQLGNMEQARSSYDKSLEANPDQPSIRATRNQIVNELTVRERAGTP